MDDVERVMCGVTEEDMRIAREIMIDPNEVIPRVGEFVMSRALTGRAANLAQAANLTRNVERLRR